MLRKECLTTDCQHCPFHGSCLMEKDMLNTIQMLNLVDKAKYELALLGQQEEQQKQKKGSKNKKKTP